QPTTLFPYTTLFRSNRSRNDRYNYSRSRRQETLTKVNCRKDLSLITSASAITRSLQVLRVQRFQVFRQEDAVFAEQFAVEPDLAAAPFLALDQHHVPMHRAAVAVIAFLIRLAG